MTSSWLVYAASLLVSPGTQYSMNSLRSDVDDCHAANVSSVFKIIEKPYLISCNDTTEKHLIVCISHVPLLNLYGTYFPCVLFQWQVLRNLRSSITYWSCKIILRIICILFDKCPQIFIFELFSFSLVFAH